MKIEMQKHLSIQMPMRECDIYHRAEEVLELLYLKDGRLHQLCYEAKMSDFDELGKFMFDMDVSKHDDVKDIRVKRMVNFGWIGSYRTDNEHFYIFHENPQKEEDNEE